MNLIVNGQNMEIPFGTTVGQLLEILKEPVRPDMIVAVNKVIIHPKKYGIVVLQENDSTDTIYIAFGG